MAENLNQKKNFIKTKIDAITKIVDDDKSKVDSFIDNKLKDLPSVDGGKLGKKFSDLESKIKKKVDNKTDIFKDLTEIVEKFLSPTKKIEPSNKLFSKQRLKQITQESIQSTTKTSKQIIIDSAQKVLFAGDGICGSDKSLPSTSIKLKPKEFDFMNVLTIDPTSNVGQIVYEQGSSNNLIKMNSKLYEQFTNGFTSYDFTTKNNNTLFSMTWDDSNQEYEFSGLDNNSKKVGTFLSDYYSNIEFIDLSGITKTAMMMTIQTDPSAPPLFEKGINDLNRLLSKILKACGNSQSNGLNQNTSNLFNENDQDDEYYFDFEDLEGIDLDDENRRYQKVLKFSDCGNLEVNSRPEHFEDFVYLSKGNLNDAVDDVLENVALSAYQDSGQSIAIDNIHLNLLNNFILNLPKAMIGLILSPKFILPIILVYKSVVMQVGTVIESAKTFMKNLSKFFKMIIKEHFWKFITEFWKRIKKDLLTFLQKIALRILKKKQRRLLAIVGSLIALLTKLLDKNLGDCNSLFNLINKTIDTALSGGGFNLPIPPPLLLAAKLRSGYSTDRAHLNILENLQAAGFNVNPVFGERNMMGDFVKSIVDGHDDEFKNNNKLLGFTIPGTTETMGIIV